MGSGAPKELEQLGLDRRPHLLGSDHASPPDGPRGYLDGIGYCFRCPTDHLGSDSFPEWSRDLNGITELLRRNGLATKDSAIEISHPFDGSARRCSLRELNDPVLWIDQQPASNGGPDERKVRPDGDSLEEFERELLGFLLWQPFEDDLLE